MSLWILETTSSTNNVAPPQADRHGILPPRTGEATSCRVREVCLLEEALLWLGESELVCRFSMAG